MLEGTNSTHYHVKTFVCYLMTLKNRRLWFPLESTTVGAELHGTVETLDVGMKAPALICFTFLWSVQEDKEILGDKSGWGHGQRSRGGHVVKCFQRFDSIQEQRCSLSCWTPLKTHCGSITFLRIRVSNMSWAESGCCTKANKEWNIQGYQDAFC